MGTNTEFDYYIPPDVNVQVDGSIQVSDWGKVYQFSDEGDDLSLLSFTGMGMPPVSYITQRGPFQQGETVLDYRLSPRTIQFVHRRNTCSRQDYWDTARGDLLNKLRPSRQLANTFNRGRLRKIQPDGTMRDIFALVEFGPVFNARNLDQWDEWSVTETIRFVCHDPTWFDPAEQQVSWELVQFAGLIFYESPDWEDHLTFPIVFGADAISAFQSITYTGTWESFPTIQIVGPLNQPQVENTTTDEKIELDYDIALGETVTIDLSFGNKTVVNNLGTNLIGTVTTDSDLGTFHIAPDPEAAGGINVINGSGSGGVLGTTEIILTYNTRYIGI